MTVYPLPISKGMQGITGEAGPLNLHFVVTLGQPFEGEKVLVCGLEMSLQTNSKK